MLELSCTAPTPETSEELDLAVRHYQSSDLAGFELFCQWQAIREASLEQSRPEEGDLVPGADSY